MLVPDIDPAPVCKCSTTGTALKRCRDVWQRAYDAVYAELIESRDEIDSMTMAAEAGGKAYCSALPVLFDRDGVPNFISCVAHGVLIGAILEKKAARLLYAAQVAAAALPGPTRPAKQSKILRTPSPSTGKK